MILYFGINNYIQKIHNKLKIDSVYLIVSDSVLNSTNNGVLLSLIWKLFIGDV